MGATKIKKVEFKNVTIGETIFITTGRNDRSEGRPTRVDPGKSAFLTPDDLDFYRDDPRFVKGKIRKAGLDTILAGDIKVRDDMSDIEITVLVEKTKDARSLGNKMKPLTSITTVSGILDACKKQDKPFSFIETCLRKLNTLSDRMEIDIKNMKKDEKKED
jgi:hypothetical protein